MSIYGYEDDKKWEDFKDSFKSNLVGIPLGIISVQCFMYSFARSPGEDYSILAFFAGLLIGILACVCITVGGFCIFRPPKSLGARIRNLPWSIGLAFREWRIKRIKRKTEACRQESLQAEHRKWLKQQAAEKKAELRNLMLEERKQLKSKILSGGEVSIAHNDTKSGAISIAEEHPYGRSRQHAEINARVDKILGDYEDYESPSESYEDKRSWRRRR